MTHGHVLKRCRSDRVEAVELESGRDWRHITRTQVVEGSSVTVKLFPGSSWNGRSLSTISQKRAVKRMQSTPRRFGRVERPFWPSPCRLRVVTQELPVGTWRVALHPDACGAIRSMGVEDLRKVLQQRRVGKSSEGNGARLVSR